MNQSDQKLHDGVEGQEQPSHSQLEAGQTPDEETGDVTKDNVRDFSTQPATPDELAVWREHYLVPEISTDGQEHKPTQGVTGLETEHERTEMRAVEETTYTPEDISFNTERCTLLLHVGGDSLEVDNLKEGVEQAGFDRKGEFHVTVLGFKAGAEIKKLLKRLPPEEHEAKLAEIQTIVDSMDWSFVPEEGAYHISKEYRTMDPKNKGVEIVETKESYIQKVHMPAVNEFYEKLNTLLGLRLETPPAHVTLYTNGTNKETAKMGIGINSEAELSQLRPERYIPTRTPRE